MAHDYADERTRMGDTPDDGPDFDAPMGTRSGYVFELSRDANGTWDRSSSEDWAIEVYQPAGDEKEVGARAIDGAPCIVFLCRDAQYRAVTRVNLGR